MARYNNTNTTEETTTEDRREYAQKWVQHYFAVKALLADGHASTEQEAVDYLVSQWEAKASEAKEDRSL